VSHRALHSVPLQVRLSFLPHLARSMRPSASNPALPRRPRAPPLLAGVGCTSAGWSIRGRGRRSTRDSCPGSSRASAGAMLASLAGRDDRPNSPRLARINSTSALIPTSRQHLTLSCTPRAVHLQKDPCPPRPPSSSSRRTACTNQARVARLVLVRSPLSLGFYLLDQVARPVARPGRTTTLASHIAQ